MKDLLLRMMRLLGVAKRKEPIKIEKSWENTPKNIEQAVNAWIDEYGDHESIQKLISYLDEGFFVSTLHHGIGTDIRNRWGLWQQSPLALWFNQFGIYHPDDMSGIIMTSAFRKMLGQDIRFDEQARKRLEIQLSLEGKE